MSPRVRQPDSIGRIKKWATVVTDRQIACIDHPQIICPTGNMKTEHSEHGKLHREPRSWPGLVALRGICHRFLRLESLALGSHNVPSSS